MKTSKLTDPAKKRRAHYKGAEHRREYLRRWYAANRERILAMQKEPERAAHIREVDRAWRATNPDRVRELERIYRARRAAESPVQRERRLKQNRDSYRRKRIRQGLAVMPKKQAV